MLNVLIFLLARVGLIALFIAPPFFAFLLLGVGILGVLVRISGDVHELLAIQKAKLETEKEKEKS